MGLLGIFRNNGLGVPSIGLLLDLFSVNKASKGFLHISKWANARLIIFELSSSHKHWNERYFFIGGRNWEYNPIDKEDTFGVPKVWTALENLRGFLTGLVEFSF